MSFVSESRTQVVPRTLLVVLRVYLGVIFLVATVPKWAADPSWGSNLAATLGRGALQRGHPFYQDFLRAVVIPNATLFGNLIMAGELLTGLSLLTGTATRLGAAGAMWLVLNYMFSKAAWWWVPSSNDAAFFMIGLVLILGAAGRSFGVDFFLAKRWPKAGIW